MKILLSGLVSKDAVINHAEVGMKKPKKKSPADSTENNTAKVEKDATLKKFNQRFKI